MTLKIPKITYISIFLIALNMKVLSKSLQGASKYNRKSLEFQGFFACSEQKHDKILGYSESSIEEILFL